MKRKDDKIAQLYSELYNGAHASAELKGKVRTMDQNTKKTVRASKKITAALAAAAIVAVGGTIVTSATHKTYIGQYTTAYLNGEEMQARYGSWDNIGTYIIEVEKNGKTYSAYVRGEYDKDTMPLYFNDTGKYVIASTDPDQQLNLYDDIDKAPHARIQNDWLELDESYLHTETEDQSYAYCQPYSVRISLEMDDRDGEKDGVLKHDSTLYETYIVTPEGMVVNAFKSKGTMLDDDYYTTMWGYIWGEETWESFQEYENAYRDSDGTVVID